MSDDEPLRWSDEASDALMPRLMRAGRADGPSVRALSAAPVAVAALLLSSAPVGAAAAPAGGTAATLAAKTALSPVLLVKWVGIGALASSSALVALHAPELLGSKPAPASVAAPVRPAPPRPAPAPSAATVAVVAPPASVAAASLGVRSAPATQSVDVAREVALLDEARNALVGGDAGEALRILDSLDRLPARSLVPEATVLRVRALLAHGQRAEAQNLVAQFCAAAPHSPQAGVLRALLANSGIRPMPSPL